MYTAYINVMCMQYLNVNTQCANTNVCTNVYCQFRFAGLTLCFPLRCVKWKQTVNYRDNRTYHIQNDVR
jgi:hypothetical protein